MLKEIFCDFFTNKKITFHEGLNIILGDDDAKNSIGKSTALMVIDFVFGGDSLLHDDAGAIRALGHHSYFFKFEFDKTTIIFSRSTDAPESIFICDDNHAHVKEITINEYRENLKKLYNLSNVESSFRSIISPFSRIWKKGGLEPDLPFNASPREPNGTAISRLIDLLGFNDLVAEEKKLIENIKTRKKLIRDSMNAEIIPSIKKHKYKENSEIIQSNNFIIRELKEGFQGALKAYESLFDENLKKMQQRKNELLEIIKINLTKIERLKRELSGISPRLAKNIGLVAEFFPTVNLERLEQVEKFHHKIGSIVKKELTQQLDGILNENEQIEQEIKGLETEIKLSLESKGMPDDLFNKLFQLKEQTDKALQENHFFEQKNMLEESLKTASSRLDSIYTNIFLELENKINSKLKSFNRVVYGSERKSSELRVKNSSSFSFTSPQDTGTGKSYAGLIGFDLTMLALSKLPLVIHDSVIYKNIEIAATARIFRILAAVKRKQIFISFDEAKKFGERTENLILKHTALKLSHDSLLYTKDWR